MVSPSIRDHLCSGFYLAPHFPTPQREHKSLSFSFCFWPHSPLPPQHGKFSGGLPEQNLLSTSLTGSHLTFSQGLSGPQEKKSNILLQDQFLPTFYLTGLRMKTLLQVIPGTCKTWGSDPSAVWPSWSPSITWPNTKPIRQSSNRSGPWLPEYC